MLCADLLLLSSAALTFPFSLFLHLYLLPSSLPPLLPSSLPLLPSSPPPSFPSPPLPPSLLPPPSCSPLLFPLPFTLLPSSSYFFPSSLSLLPPSSSLSPPFSFLSPSLDSQCKAFHLAGMGLCCRGDTITPGCIRFYH